MFVFSFGSVFHVVYLNAYIALSGTARLNILHILTSRTQTLGLKRRPWDLKGVSVQTGGSPAAHLSEGVGASSAYTPSSLTEVQCLTLLASYFLPRPG